MRLLRLGQPLDGARSGCVLTIGNYDGVHLGHRAVIEQVTASAARRSLPAAVMVFEPTPREFFAPEQAPARLSTLREKTCALATTGVDAAICARFDQRMASMSPEAFIDELLVAGLGVRHLVVGDDFRFGYRRRGDFDMLKTAGARAGFEVDSTPAFRIEGLRISSTAVREALARHDLDGARRLLGRRYSMVGRVRRGARLGRRLGYPTANIAPQRRVLPLHGVYAVRVEGAGRSGWPGVASIGTRPTVDGRETLLEVHLFDFDGSLYNRMLEVTFVAWLRPERHYDEVTEMVEQMHRDASAARAILEAEGDA